MLVPSQHACSLTTCLFPHNMLVCATLVIKRFLAAPALGQELSQTKISYFQMDYVTKEEVYW